LSDARLIAERLGVPQEAVRGVQRHGFLRRLDLTDAEIRERLWRAHLVHTRAIVTTPRARLELLLIVVALGVGASIPLLALSDLGEQLRRLPAEAAQLERSGSSPPITELAAGELARDQAARRRMAPTLAHARRIALRVGQRSVGVSRLAVTDVSLTSIVATIELGAGRSRPARSIPADEGIHFAVCPAASSTCLAPARDGSQAAARAARRLGLELALRTFLETSAKLVVVALPRAKAPIALVFERSLLDVIDGEASLRRLHRNSVPLERLDRIVGAHLVALAGLASYSQTRDSLLVVPLELGPASERRVAGPW